MSLLPTTFRKMKGEDDHDSLRRVDGNKLERQRRGGVGS